MQVDSIITVPPHWWQCHYIQQHQTGIIEANSWGLMHTGDEQVHGCAWLWCFLGKSGRNSDWPCTFTGYCMAGNMAVSRSGEGLSIFCLRGQSMAASTWALQIWHGQHSDHLNNRKKLKGIYNSPTTVGSQKCKLLCICDQYIAILLMHCDRTADDLSHTSCPSARIFTLSCCTCISLANHWLV